MGEPITPPQRRHPPQIEVNQAMRNLNRNTSLAVLAVTTALASTTSASAQEMVFSIDWHGPTIGAPDATFGKPITEGDLLTPSTASGMPELGPLGTPKIALDHVLGLGLLPGCTGHPAGTPCHVELDAVSYGVDRMALPEDIAPGQLHYSVDEFAAGGPHGVAPNLITEAPFGDAAADDFTNTMFLPMAPLPPGPAFDWTGIIDGNGTMSGSGYSYPGLGLIEPSFPAPGPLRAGDNLDALNLDTPPSGPAGSMPFPLTGVYFSLDAPWADPLTGLPHTGSAPIHGFSAADVLLTPAAGSAPSVWAPGPALGLNIAHPFIEDDLDALIICLNSAAGYQPSHVPYDWASGVSDMVLFSVRRGSPVIGMPDSIFGIPIEEGDILTAPLDTALGGVSPFPGIFIAAENLGLATVRSGMVPAGSFADDVDALDMTSGPMKDCNGNFGDDAVDIALGFELDLNLNGIPDSCEGGLLVNPYCFCESGAPCGNTDAFAGCSNSTGSGCLLGAAGTSSVLADDLILTITGATPSEFGLPFMGPTQIAPVMLGDGLRCVDGALFRHGVIMADAAGSATYGPGVVAHSIANFPVVGHIVAGSTWSFQVWYRDPSGPCGTGSNISNALAVTFTP